jgi:hypothetical protein
VNAPKPIADRSTPAETIGLRHGLCAVLASHTDAEPPPDDSVDPELSRRRRRQAGAARSRRQFAEAQRRDPGIFL